MKKRKHVRYTVQYVNRFYQLHFAFFNRMPDMVFWLIEYAPKICLYIKKIEKDFV